MKTTPNYSNNEQPSKVNVKAIQHESTITELEIAIILMQCGCLNDIAEKSRETDIKQNIKDVQIKLEAIATRLYQIGIIKYKKT